MSERKPFILIVEDDRPLLGVLTRYLQARGYIVLQATSYSEALDKLAIKPDLMLLDIKLPDANGWAVASWLESLGQPVPIIVMSGSIEADARQLRKPAVKAFLAKPFPVEDLMRLVKEYAPAPQLLS